MTDDHINPDYAWPALRELEALAGSACVPLRERLPVYERFLPDGIGRRTSAERTASERDGRSNDAATGNGWVSGRIARAIEAEDGAGERYRAVLNGNR